MCLSLGDSGCHVACLYLERMRRRQSTFVIQLTLVPCSSYGGLNAQQCCSQSLDYQGVKDIIPSIKSSLVFKKSLCHWCKIMDPDWTSIYIHPHRVFKEFFSDWWRSVLMLHLKGLDGCHDDFYTVLISFRILTFRLYIIFEFLRSSFYETILVV